MKKMYLTEINIECQCVNKFTNPFLEDEVNGKISPFYRLFYLKSGEMDFFVDENKISLTKGDVLFLPANTLYNTRAYSKPLEIINVSFTFFHTCENPSYSENNCFTEKTDKDFRVYFNDFSEFNNLKVFKHVLLEREFNFLESIYYKHGIINKLKLNSRLSLLLFDLIEEKNKKGGMFDEIEEYISNNVFSDISCKSVAEYFGYHPNYLNRIVHEKTGNNLHFIITSAKIKSACKMLLEGSKSVTEIAEELFFYDNSHFTKTFIKSTGISPSEYRKMYS